MISVSKSLKRMCSDVSKIENYDIAVNDNINKWDCHHRLETHTSDGERRIVNISSSELMEV